MLFVFKKLFPVYIQIGFTFLALQVYKVEVFD